MSDEDAIRALILRWANAIEPAISNQFSSVWIRTS